MSANGISQAAATNGHGQSTETSLQNDKSMPIAIIGMACRFPGEATNVENFWNMLTSKRDAWTEVPKERFNVDAFYHPDPDRNGSFNSRGGYFLSQDISAFDAQFFSISPAEAKSMDPQQRILLETVYDAMENAGLPLETVMGSETSCYIANVSRDYYDILARDPETLPVYQSTGNGASIISNRVSYFYNLKGPSMTLDSACSSSLVAIHLACQSIQSGESKQAIVGATNMVIAPDLNIGLSNLHFLSPDARCYSFDSRSNGYVRGEGIGAVILKPLEQALTDNDLIRAVIRGSSCNQDGRTAGITLPSQSAQEALITKAYDVAGCDPAVTTYFEAHGTGTKVGDPIETGAIGATMGPHRTPGEDGNLYIGSVKPNIGHLEAASGLAGLIKTVLSLEKGVIAPNILYENPNARIDFQGWRIKVPTSVVPWPVQGLRRASVNSFGYGGTNAHVILDDALHYLQARKLRGLHNTASKPLLQENIGRESAVGDQYHHTNDRRDRVFVWTGQEEGAVKSLCASYAQYCASIKPEDAEAFLDSLAHTLWERRSRLQWTTSVVANSTESLVQALQSDTLVAARRSNGAVKIGFVFTGQGAQWWGMGRELISAYQTFRQTLVDADQAVKGFGADWSLIDELLRDETESRINEPLISQTVCTAVQIAIVNLLDEWNIKPTQVIGHSSGEIAAAYTAGALNLLSAMKVAYFRGVYSAQVSQHIPGGGAMLAAGISEKDATERIQVLDQKLGRVVVACVNSPASVTFSGDSLAIHQLQKSITQDGFFARGLKVKTAYHSHHMAHVADGYLSSISGINKTDLKRQQSVGFTSTVTGASISHESLDPEYWVKNMLSCVRFSDGLRNMLEQQPKKRSIRKGTRPAVDILVEIGPHSALAGPIRQVLAGSNLEKGVVAYQSALTRGTNATRTLLELVASLAEKGYPTNLQHVNFPGAHRSYNVQLLANLPSYPWNHTKKYWSESRISSNYRFRKHPRHNLLGAPVPDWNPAEPRWRNYIRISEQPWVKQHQVQGAVIYPAAGYICAAVEAAAQMANLSQGQKVKGFKLREISVSRAVIVPEDDGGIEVVLSLRPFRTGSAGGATSDSWKEFVVSSWAMGEWMENCRGLISTVYEHKLNEVFGEKEDILSSQQHDSDWALALKLCETKKDPNELFEQCARNGNDYGPIFRNFVGLSSGAGHALSSIKIPRVADVLPENYDQKHIIHPITLDAVMQMLFLTFPEKQEALVPVWIDEIDFSINVPNEVGTIFRCHSTAVSTGARDVVLDITASSSDSSAPLVKFKGLKCVALSSPSETANQSSQVKKHCFNMVWEADIDLLTKEQADTMLKECYIEEVNSELVAKFELVSYYFFHQLLQNTTKDDVRSMLPHHQKFLQYMDHQRQKVLEGKSSHQTAEWLELGKPEAAAKMEQLISVIDQTGYEGELLCRIGRRLKSIMNQEIHPLTLMLEGGLLHNYYAKGIGHRTLHAQYTKYFTMLSHKYPNLDYLEIGGGTAGSTIPILNVLGGDNGKYPRFRSYTFTDISPGFFEKAGEKLKAWGDLVRYQKLNIEGDLADQGFKGNKYDVIVAANVLHATTSMDRTLMNVRSLLKPGGKLILLEITNSLLRINLMFGVLPGWWLSEESERQWGPTMTVDGWEAAFKRNRFTGITATGPDFPNERDYLCRVMVTTAAEEGNALEISHRAPAGALVVVRNTKSDESRKFSSQIQHGLESRNIPYLLRTIDNLKESDFAGRACISLLELEAPLLKDIQPSEFDVLKNIVVKTDGLLWITQGAGQTSPRPELALINGLARTVRTENTGYPLVVYDVDTHVAGASATVVDTLLSVFESTCINERWSEQEYSERHGITSIKRCVEDADLNMEVAQLAQGVQSPPTQQSLHQPGRPLKLDEKALNDFLFVDDVEALKELPPDYAEIEVRAVGVNIRDIMVSLGQINESDQGCECSGVVTRVGTGVTNVCVGDRVAAWVFGAYYSNVARAPAIAFQRLPDEVSFKMGASLPVAFCTAYYGLATMARIERRESVLIHAAAGAVGQAAIMLCQHYGADIFITVGSKAKKQHLMEIYGITEDHIFSSRDTTFVDGIMRMTQGKGVSVVLNSLSGEMLKTTWRCVAPFGRFIELGKKDIVDNTRLDMAPFIRNIVFASVNMIVVYKDMPQFGAEIFSNVIKLIRKKTLYEVTPITTYSFSQMEEAFRFMQSGKHTGKIVIVPNQTDVVRAATEPQKRWVFSPDASYLLVGGLGGLGRSIAAWMGANGAKHIIVVSRSGVRTESAIKLVEELTLTGVHIEGLKCDVADRASLNKTLEATLTRMPKIRGVVVAAMVLEDQVFENMRFESFQKVVRPKVQGTWNVHQATLSQPLDFFIMLSSLSGIIGNASQANYAAGNAYQDAMAYYRRSLGLPAVSIDLGMIDSVGWVAENQEIAARNLKRWGYLAIEESELIAMLELSMKRDTEFASKKMTNGSPPLSSCQVVTGAGTMDIFGLEDLPPYFNSPTFCHLKQMRDRTKSDEGTLAKESLAQLLERNEQAADAAGIILDALLVKLSKLLMISVEDLNVSRPMTSYGIDSLVAVEVRNWLVKEAKADIPVMVILQSSSLNELAGKVAEKSRLVKRETLDH